MALAGQSGVGNFTYKTKPSTWTLSYISGEVQASRTSSSHISSWRGQGELTALPPHPRQATTPLPQALSLIQISQGQSALEMARGWSAEDTGHLPKPEASGTHIYWGSFKTGLAFNRLAAAPKHRRVTASLFFRGMFSENPGAGADQTSLSTSQAGCTGWSCPAAGVPSCIAPFPEVEHSLG